MAQQTQNAIDLQIQNVKDKLAQAEEYLANGWGDPDKLRETVDRERAVLARLEKMHNEDSAHAHLIEVEQVVRRDG